MNDRARDQQKLRERMIRRQNIIFQVCQEYGTTDLNNDKVFAEICRRLTEEGFELAENDMWRYELIISRQPAKVVSNEI